MGPRIDILLLVIPALPLAAAVLTGILGPRVLRAQSHVLVILSLGLAAVCSLFLLNAVYVQQQQPVGPAQQPVAAMGYEHTVTLWRWVGIPDALNMPARPSAGDNEFGLADRGPRDFTIDVTLRADALSAMMISMVTFVATLVAIFSVGYMRGDRGYWRFFTYLALFVFSMAMLVLVSNFLLLFVFWEAVGVCSYLLIGFWYQKPEAAAAGKKAFLVNRVGDFGFSIALFLIWTTYGTLNYHDTLSNGSTDPDRVATVAAQEIAGENITEPRLVRGVLGRWRVLANDYYTGGIALTICLLLLVGAAGKSAQFPLHVWLPDAMEGPTPVSALIHAATMVTAGVYMVARCTPLFMASPTAQVIVSVIGGFTALLAALIALTQFDLKRVLAYSTVSQLGYMFLALGTGSLAGITGGMFHLFTHAFFKALLFLGAGSVMHAMGNVIDMRKFGGLRSVMPYTFLTFFVGSLALAGIMPLSGFWSKDAVLGAVHDKIHDLEHAGHHATDGGDDHGTTHGAILNPSQQYFVSNAIAPVESETGHSAAQPAWMLTTYKWLYWSGIFTAFLTAFYTFRALLLTFFGPRRVPPEAAGHAHESPPEMLLPLVVLAIGAAAVGMFLDRSWTGEPSHLFGDFLINTPSLAGAAIAATPRLGTFHIAVAGTSTVVALAGVLLSAYLFLGDRREINYVKAIFDFEALGRFADVQSVARLGKLDGVQRVQGFADRLYLGWLARTAGWLVMLFVLIIAAPLTLGRYFSPYRLSYGKFFVDELYQILFVMPLRGLAAFSYLLDRWLVDGIVDGLGHVPPALGRLMRSMQIGLVQFYALAMLLAVLALVLVKTIWLGEAP